MKMLNEYAKQIVSGLDEKNGKQKKPLPKNKTLVSDVLDDGSLVEMIYSPSEEKTLFAVFTQGQLDYKDTVEIGSMIYAPVSPHSDLLKHKVILFPSAAIEFDSVSALLNRINKFVNKYLQLSPFFEKMVAHYVLFTWLYDAFNELPYLRALGDYGSGKTRFLQTVGFICYKPMFVSGASTVSPMFRIISEFRGTLVLDEADFRFSDTQQEIVKILNQGFSASCPVLRSESNGKSFDVKAYNVFGPKLIATREYFQDGALESRCLTEKMEKRTRLDIPLNLTQEFYDEAQKLRNQLLMFRFKHYNKNITLEAYIDESIEPRLNQIMVPLLSVIDDESLKDDLKAFIKEQGSNLAADRAYTVEAEVLEALIEVLDQNPEPTIQSITDKLNENADAKDSLTARKVGHIVRKKLDLSAVKTRVGICLINSPSNLEKISKLKIRYGVNVVTDVNVPEGNDIEVTNNSALVQAAEEIFESKAEEVV